MVQHRRGRGLMLFSAALSCGGGLGLALLGVWELNHRLIGPDTRPPSLVELCYAALAAGAILGLCGAMGIAQRAARWRVIAINGGLLLGVSLLALSRQTQGWETATLTLAAGSGIILTAAISFALGRSRS